MQQDGDMEAGVRSLLEVNNLGYRMTPGMSVATSRVTREWNAIRATYFEGDILSFPISSGAAYVDPDNSYITFDINIVETTDGVDEAKNYLFFWGGDPGSRQTALNLFQDMRLTHSSGYEIDRVTRGFGPWKNIQLAYTKDQEWWDTYGSLMRGYQVSNVGDLLFGRDGSGGAYPRAVPTTAPDSGIPTSLDDSKGTYYVSNDVKITVTAGAPATVDRVWNDPNMKPFAGTGAANQTLRIRVIIPLSAISGVWDTDQLSPSFLMAGARLDLTLQNHQQVWQVRSRVGESGGNAIKSGLYSYNITNPKIVLETITFTDAVLRSISMTSANVGLEIPFVAMHYSNAPVIGTDMSVQINRGLSRANLIVARIYPNTATANTNRTCKLDSNACYFIEPTAQGFQVKLGAEFMPAVPIKDRMQLYHATQVAFGNWKADRRNTVRLIDYCGDSEFKTDSATQAFRFCPYSTLGCYAMTLEKSSTLAQSGSPISAARDLNIVFGGPNFANYTDALWGGLSVDVFVPYVQLATVFLDSVLTRS